MAGERGVGAKVAVETPLRLAVMIVEPIAYRLVAAWAERHGHRLALLVTTPGPPHTWHNRDYHDLVGAVPATQDVLVSRRMRRVVAPVLAALAPDLVLSFTFPHRIPPEIVALPRFGAVNLHPTPLPAYRGPNPRRMLFDQRPTIGAALHRIEPGFDAGALLSCQEQPLPSESTPETVLALWLTLLDQALEVGMARALKGEPGAPQDERAASYSPPFTMAERRLDWSWSIQELRRRLLALNLFHPEAWTEIDGRPYAVGSLTPRPARAEGGIATKPAGSILALDDDRAAIVVADGVVEVELVPLEEGRVVAGGGGEGW